MKTVWKSLVLVLIIGFIFIFNGTSLGAGKKPYKLGGVFSVTGGASFLGNPQKKTTEMLVEEINAAGGINGHPLEVVIYDDESDDTKSRILVTKLMKTELVLGVSGPSITGTSMAAVDLAAQYECPLISHGASWQIVVDPKTKKPRYWVFKIPGDDTHSVEKFYEFMKKKGISKIAILTVTTAYGASGREALLNLAPTYGISIVADEKFGPKDVDMTAQLTRIRASGPQAILGVTIGPTQVTIIRNWRDLAMTSIPFFQSFGFGNRDNIKLAAGAAEGVYTQVSGSTVARLLPDNDVQKKVTMEYNLAYEKKYGEPVSVFGSNGWDGLMLFVDALKQVGEKYSTVPGLRKAIRDHIENRKGFVGQNGVFNFSPASHVGLTKDAYRMVIVKGSDFVFAE
jgi:branched-chain amino acid transport system substrate-binding protein